MEANFHLYVVVMLHIGFAAAIRLWQGNERFSRLFAASWLIEAVRAAILLPEVRELGQSFAHEWFALGEVLCFLSTGLLIASGAALMERRLSKPMMLAYLGIGIPAVLLGRYWGPSLIQNWFSVLAETAQFAAIEFNLTVMFVPATLLRTVFAWWLFLTWKKDRDVGAMVAVVSAVLYAMVAIVVPFQFYFKWYPDWWRFFWCVRVFGFSMGMLMLIIRRSEHQLRESNEQLRSAMDQLETAQEKALQEARLKALGKMAAGVAHDINNTLTPLTAYAHLLETSGNQSARAKELTRLIQLGATDMAQIVLRLNHFYRDSHNAESLESVDLAQVVEESIKLTQPKWQDIAGMAGKQISVSSQISNRPIVRGEASQLRSVVTNLIFNACEAIENKGTIELEVTSDEENAVVAITDNGIGMTPEQLEHCFEPFYTSKDDGTGLGLSACRGIIRQHGGTVSVDSTVGQSTTVQFTIPVDKNPVKPKTSQVPTEPVLQSSVPQILCVDDDAEVTFATTALLSSLPATIVAAKDGPSALESLSETNFDLVVCDQGLPGMDGLTVLRAIKERWPDLPVIMVSGWSLPEVVDGPSPDAFIAKPYEPEAFCELVCQQLHRSQAARVS